MAHLRITGHDFTYEYRRAPNESVPERLRREIPKKKETDELRFQIADSRGTIHDALFPNGIPKDPSFVILPDNIETAVWFTRLHISRAVFDLTVRGETLRGYRVVVHDRDGRWCVISPVSESNIIEPASPAIRKIAHPT